MRSLAPGAVIRTALPPMARPFTDTPADTTPAVAPHTDAEREAMLARMTTHGDDPLLKFFGSDYIPCAQDTELLQHRIRAAAMALVQLLPVCAERTVALRKLLEAQDAMVRARISTLHRA